MGATIANASQASPAPRQNNKQKASPLTVVSIRYTSSKHWRELEQLIEHDALFTLPDKIGCPGCTDGLTEFLEVKFSDHTKKSVFYDSAPTDILALSQKLSALEAKLEQELPVNRPND